MKRFLRQWGYELLFVVVTIFLFCLGVYWLIDLDNRRASMLGEEVIIKSDTLIITDYSLFTNTYQLNNGTSVSIELIKNVK